MEIVRAKEGVEGFAVQPRRWIIERTFFWLTHNRRPVRNDETREVNSEAMPLIAASKLMRKLLARRHYQTVAYASREARRPKAWKLNWQSLESIGFTLAATPHDAIFQTRPLVSNICRTKD